jgi:hypothetical protein
MRFNKILQAKQDPQYFLTDNYFINWQEGECPYPFQMETFCSFYRGHYKELSIAGGMGGGKTRLTALFVCYDLFDLLTRENPGRDWNLASHAKIFALCIAKSDDQAADTVFNEVKTIISNSAFFQEYAPHFTEYNITFDKHPDIEVYAVGAASAGSTVGRNVKIVAFDEIDSYDETQSQRGAWSVYSRIRKSTNRFGFDGHVIAISSPWHAHSVIMTLAKRTDPKTLALIAPTWVMNPNKPFDSPEMQAELERDPETFWRDYGCDPHSSTSSYYSDPAIIKVTERENALAQTGEHIWDLGNLAHLNPNFYYILAIDPGQRDDCFGTALLHAESDPIVGRKVIADGISRLIPKKDQMLNPLDIKKYLITILEQAPIRLFVTDQLWFYTEAIAEIEQKLGKANVLSKPNTKAEHDAVKNSWFEGKFELCNFPYVKQEFQNLKVIDSKKIGIIKGGKIDVVDALTRGYWAASQRLDVAFYPNMIVII